MRTVSCKRQNILSNPHFLRSVSKYLAIVPHVKMSSKLADPEKHYSEDPNLKREDVQTIFQWLKKQPHLPELKEIQVIFSLHICQYQIEAAKRRIDAYFSIRTHYPDLFTCPSEEIIRQTLSAGFIGVLPKKTPEGYVILLQKLLDYRPEKYVCVNNLRMSVMALTLYLHQYGPVNGLVMLADTKGGTLNHLARANMMAAKQVWYFLQEMAPIKVKGIHYINTMPVTEKLITFLRPFIKREIFNMINVHTSFSENFYKQIPRECLPEDYGGKLPSIQMLHEENVRNILENMDILRWHDTQTVDELKRFEKSTYVNAAFGMEGTFKKLEID